MPDQNPVFDEPPPRSFLAREWFWLLLVLWTLAMIIFTMMLPAPAVEEGAVTLDNAPTSMEIMGRLDARPGLKLLLFSFAGGGLLLFLAGLPLLGYLLWQRLENGVPILGRPQPPDPVHWGIWDVIKTAALYFLLLQALGALGLLLIPGETGDISLVVVFFGNLLVTLFVMLLVARRDHGWRRALGLGAGRFLPRVREGLVGYVAFFPLLVASALMAVLAAHLFGLEAEQNPLVPMVLGSDSTWF